MSRVASIKKFLNLIYYKSKLMKNIVFISLLILLGCNQNKLNNEKNIIKNFGIVIHGGAGTILKENMSEKMEIQYRNALSKAIRVGHEILKNGGTSQQAVEKSINILENSPLFNSGKGAVLNSDGYAELDASFMDGKTLNAGAISGATKIKNPIRAAIKVMENSPHVMLSSSGADEFAKKEGLEMVNTDYFITEKRKKNLERVQKRLNLKIIGNEIYINTAHQNGIPILGTNDLKDQFENMRSKLTDYELTFMKTNNDSYVSSLILQRMLMQQEIEFEQAEELFNNFSELIKLTTSSINIKETLDYIKESKKESPTIGSLAPKFSGPGLNGDVIEFENVNSKVIMIDFWASWCGPCRDENPHLISLNSKYTTDQFQIVGVSLDRDKESWENAINNDQLNNWIHISHIKFWNEPIAKLYNVTRMPTTFILNSEKRIIAMDAKGSDLEKIIIKQLSL